MEANISVQKFVCNFNICLLKYSDLRKQSLSIFFWVRWVAWKTGWFSSVLKLLHMFTHELGSFLQRCCMPFPLLHTCKWIFTGKDSTKPKAYRCFNSILKWKASFPPPPPAEWCHTLGAWCTIMPTLLLYTAKGKNNSFQTLALLSPRHRPRVQSPE